ncbi:MAG: hypothetical protein ACREFW_06200 [Rhizomicrobium sp.]
MHFRYVVALLLLTAGPAMAQANCQSPIAPVAPDGRSATQAQMVAAANDARRFIRDSDTFQQCLVDYVIAQRKQAKDNKTTFDKSIADDATKRVDENQATKVKVGANVNSALAAYKSAHPQ